MERHDKLRRQPGVTLLELLLVIVLLGVLVATAMPSYRAYALRTHRTEATRALLRMLTNQERFRLTHHRYSNDLGALGFNDGCSENCVYTIDFVLAPDVALFTARARPTAGGGTNGVDQSADTDCQWFTITQNGLRDAGPGDRCW